MSRTLRLVDRDGLEPPPDRGRLMTAAQVAVGLSFVVYGLAAPAGSKTIGRGKAGQTFIRDASSKSAPWKRQVAQEAGEAMDGRQLFDEPLELELLFIQPRPKSHYRRNGHVHDWAPGAPTTKPDLTKLVRAVEDALTSVVWRDDALVVRQLVSKVYGEPARCHVQVRLFDIGATR